MECEFLEDKEPVHLYILQSTLLIVDICLLNQFTLGLSRSILVIQQICLMVSSSQDGLDYAIITNVYCMKTLRFSSCFSLTHVLWRSLFIKVTQGYRMRGLISIYASHDHQGKKREYGKLHTGL